MADNTTVKDAADLTVTIATDDVSSVHYQRIKLDLGADGASTPVEGTVPVSATNLDIRDLSAAQDSVNARLQDGAGNAVTSTVAGSQRGLDIVIRDATGNELDLRQENENWNAADHGILVFGRDIASTPDKYRAFALNTEGDLYVDLSDINGVEPAVNTGNADNGTLRVVLASNQPAVTVAQATATNLKAEVVGTGTFAVQAAATLAAETTKVIGTVNVAAAQTIAVTQATAASLKAEVSNAGTFAVQPTIPTLPTWVVSTGNTAHVAAARTTLFDLFNASGSGAVLKVRGVFIQPTLAAVTGVGQTYELIRTSAVGTGGGTATPVPYDTASSALHANITARTKPTGGATTATTLLYVNGSSEETNPYAALSAVLNHVRGFNTPLVEPLVLREGQGLKVDQTTNSAVGSVNVVVLFTVG